MGTPTCVRATLALVKWRFSALLLSASLAGCNRYVAVEPMELVRIAAMPEPPAHSVRTLEGELEKIDGEFDVVVRTIAGDYDFSGPVSAWFAPGVLVVSGANEPATGFPLAEIRQIDLKQFSGGRTAVAIVTPISAVVLVLVLLATGTAGH